MSYFSKLHDSGFLVLKNVLNDTEKKKIVKAFYQVLSKYLKIGKNHSNLNLSDTFLHNKLIDFRKKNPKIFGFQNVIFYFTFVLMQSRHKRN